MLKAEVKGLRTEQSIKRSMASYVRLLVAISVQFFVLLTMDVTDKYEY